MPSTFPGMDPYLESPEIWPDFHGSFMNVIRERMVPLVRPRYSVRIEERVYLEFEPEGREALIRPDLTLSDRGWGPPASTPSSAAAAVPVKVAVVIPEEIREVSLVIRHQEFQRVVTVVELLSPSNKRARSVGRETYLEKRNAILKSEVHLMEIDLLRGGEKMPMLGPLPPGDYHVVLSRGERRPECDVFSWRLRDRLPEIPIPLAAGDPDVSLDLQAVLDTVYERAGYDYTIRYEMEPDPPLRAEDVDWAREKAARRGP